MKEERRSSCYLTLAEQRRPSALIFVCPYGCVGVCVAQNRAKIAAFIVSSSDACYDGWHC